MSFQAKLEFSKSYTHHLDPLDSFPIFKDSYEISGDINDCNFLKLHKEIYKHLENRHRLNKSTFSNDQGRILQNHIWIKDPFKVQWMLM